MIFSVSYENENNQRVNTTFQNVVIILFIKKILTLCHKKCNPFFSIPATMKLAITRSLPVNKSQQNTITIQSVLMKKVNFILVIIGLIAALSAFGQQEKVIDASKPTNFYNSVNHAFEFTSRPDGGNLLGYRANLVLAPSEKNLILGEIPVLYNTETKNFGLGDIRARYFYLPYKNYSKFFGAFGPSIDIIAPTGNWSNGIGTGRWTIAPGIAMGLMFSEAIQVFPILSYQHMSKPVNSDSSAANNEINGGSLQFVTVIVPSPKIFFQITPTFAQSYQNESGSFSYIQEISIGYQMGPKSVLGAYCKRDFKNDLTQVSIGLTKFF